MPLAYQPGAQNLKDPFDDSKFIVLYPKISAPLRPHQSFFEQWKVVKADAHSWSKWREGMSVNTQSQIGCLSPSHLLKAEGARRRDGRKLVGVRENRSEAVSSSVTGPPSSWTHRCCDCLHHIELVNIPAQSRMEFMSASITQELWTADGFWAGESHFLSLRVGLLVGQWCSSRQLYIQECVGNTNLTW